MTKTFAQQIKTIDNIPDYLPVDKDGLIRKAFEEWNDKNSVVRAVVSGETTFSQEYQKAFAKYESWRTFTPYSLPEGFERKNADLEACIGNSPLQDTKYQKVVLNPIGLGSFWGLIGAAIATYMVKSEIRELKKAKENMSRRELLKGVALLPALLGGSGLYQGTVNASKPFIELQKMMENAIYLDSMRTKVYKK